MASAPAALARQAAAGGRSAADASAATADAGRGDGGQLRRPPPAPTTTTCAGPPRSRRPSPTRTASPSALRIGVAYEPGQLRRGAIAYAAVAALDDADLRRRRARAPARRRRRATRIVAKIFADPRHALAFADAPRRRRPGQGGAGRRPACGSSTPATRCDWPPTASSTSPGRWQTCPTATAAPAAVKQLSNAPRADRQRDRSDLDAHGRRRGAVAPTRSARAAAPYSALVVRAVALAALAAIGQAGDDDAADARLADRRLLPRPLPVRGQALALRVPGRGQAQLRGRLLPRPARDEGHRRLRGESARAAPCRSTSTRRAIDLPPGPQRRAAHARTAKS